MDTKMQPIILSSDVDFNNRYPSEYRFRIGNEIRYLSISPCTFMEDKLDVLKMPFPHLPPLPYHQDWIRSTVSRDLDTGIFHLELSNKPLEGVENAWHHVRIDCMDLENVSELAPSTFEVVCHAGVPLGDGVAPAAPTVIAKVASFERGIFNIDRETRIYQLIEGTGIGPRFLGHVHENGRVTGMLLEKVEGRPAAAADLEACRAALERLHDLGISHGDAHQYNFLVTGDGGVKLIDFEYSVEAASLEEMALEMEDLESGLEVGVDVLYDPAFDVDSEAGEFRDDGM